MNGHGGKEKCIHDGKEMLQHVGQTVTTLSYRPRYSRCVKIKRKFTIVYSIFLSYIYSYKKIDISFSHNKLNFSGS